MSSILKALRKLEEEKAALGEGRVDLARDILKRSAPPRQQKSLRVVVLLAVAAVLIMLLGLTWWWLLPPQVTTVVTTPEVPPSVEKTVQAPVPIEPQTSLDQPETPVQSPTQSQDSTKVHLPEEAAPVDPQPVASVAPPVAQNAPPVIAPQPVDPPAVPEEETDAGPVTASEQAEPFEQAEPQVTPEARPENQVLPADMPTLAIDLIIYHDAPQDRLALINDLPVMVGTVIDGVTILEILPQQVRVSWNGRDYTLSQTD